MKLLVVGNGSIGVEGNTSFFINNHTGYFLQEVSNVHSVQFVQNTTIYDQNNNLQNFDLVTHKLSFRLLPSKKSLSFFPKILGIINSNTFIYFISEVSILMKILLIVLF